MKGIGKRKLARPRDPELSALIAMVKLGKTMLTPTWQTVAASTDRRCLIGSGRLDAVEPNSLPEWMLAARKTGKPLSKAEKRVRERMVTRIASLLTLSK